MSAFCPVVAYIACVCGCVRKRGLLETDQTAYHVSRNYHISDGEFSKEYVMQLLSAVFRAISI